MNFVKVSRAKGKLSQNVVIGSHKLLADEPVASGGEDLGPNPFEYLAAALATCTALTLKLYADHKQWPLENAEITVRVSRAPDVTRLDRTVDLIGPLDQTQKDRLLDIANHCPVHKALTGKIEINTTLGKAAEA